MTTELATIPHAPSVALAHPLEFTPEQVKMIRDTYANGANDSEFRVLMEIAKVRNLNPLLRQIWFIKRWDAQKRCEVWAVQTSIDGLRTIAQRTGLYDGQDEPVFGVEDASAFGLSKAEPFATVSVYRKDWTRPATVKAYLAEYIGKTREGKPTSMWAGKPHIMLSKCAEALALRKAFPEDTAGLYVPEEMDQAQREEPAAKPEPRKARQAQEPKPALDSKTPAAAVEHLGAIKTGEVVGKEPPPVIEVQVVAEAKTESGRTLRIVEAPDQPKAAEPPPPSDKDAPTQAAEEEGDRVASLIDELDDAGPDRNLVTLWRDRKNSAHSKKPFTDAELAKLRDAFVAHKQKHGLN